MINAEELRNKCKEYMVKKDKTYDAFAKQLKISRSTVNVFVRGGEVSQTTLMRINAFFEPKSVNEVTEQPRFEACDIGFAMRMLKRGKKIKRGNWVNRYIVLKETLVDGDFEVKDVIYLVTGAIAVPWTPQPFDMFATNWEVMEDEN